MSLPVKLGAAAVGVGGTATSAYYAWDYLSSSTAKEEKSAESIPGWRPLSDDSDAATAYGGKYGEKYARLLVGVKTTDTENPDNTAWWEWSFKNSYRSTDGFGSGIDSGEKLKKECEEVYKGTLNGTKINANSVDYEEAKIWKLCSPAGKKPKAISEGSDQSNWSGKLGGNNKEYLLSMDDADNEQMWKHLDIQFKSQSSNSSGFFKISDTEPTIKALCSKAYGSDGFDSGSDSSKPKEADFYKWCSLKGVKTSS